MRPNDGSTSSSVFEVEISPLEFFQDFGVIVVEGRLPELSKHGRRTGDHSWPLTNNSKKPCCFKESKQEICRLVSNTRSKIHQSFNEKQSLFIEVFGMLDGSNLLSRQTCRVYLDKAGNKSNMILLERWEVKIVKKSFSDLNEHVNISMVLQAVRSYLHFSQLCAWWNKSNGSFPHYVSHRLCHTKSKHAVFLEVPECHKFPLTEISISEALEISVSSLRRMDIPEIMFLIKQQNNLYIFDGGGKEPSLLQNDPENTNDNSFEGSSSLGKNKISNIANQLSPTSKQILSTFSSLASSGSEPCHLNSVKRKDNGIDSYCASYARTSNCQQSNYVGEKLLKLRKTEYSNESIERSTGNIEDFVHPCSSRESNDNSLTRSSLSLSELLSQEENDCSNNTITNIPRTLTNFNSSLSLSDLLSETDYSSNNLMKKDECLSTLLQDFVLDNKNDTDCENEDEEEDDLEQYNYDDEITPPRGAVDEEFSYSSNELRPCQRRARSKSASPNFAARQKADLKKGIIMSKPIAARRLAMVAGTIPVFNPNTGLPLSSSPAPIKKPRKISETSCGSNLSKSSSLDDLQPCAFGLSRSAPPPASLLGNFEESVLNGRMIANGTLKGFWAELGASGSFCPKHISIPIQIQYFCLSDDNAPSPYLGRISLQDKKGRRKRYRVPKKGTIQLTTFNPNNTVVKVFIVLYDFNDMPAYTRTFVRQKIFSVRQDPKSMNDVQTLHYLIHLSFVASKHSHIYLHTDIRVIFRQRSPDVPLQTITDGPTNPKYTPIASKRYNNYDVNDSN